MQNKRQIILASICGTILEWYDFTIYGYLVTLVAPKFFPTENHLLSLLLTYLVFAIGFLIRPIGAIFFGSLGDKFGRRKTLTITLITMTISTVLIGLLPTYETIGSIAPLLLALLRLSQGFSAGGELVGATVFIFESSRVNKGFLSSLVWASSGIGILLGSLVVNVLAGCISQNSLELYGWRIPFLLSILTGIAAVYFRISSVETPEFLSAKKREKNSIHPLIKILNTNKLLILKIAGVYALCGITIYLLFVFMPTYLHKMHGISFKTATLTNTIAMFLMIFFVPVFGWVSDKITGIWPMLIASLFFLISSYFTYMLLQNTLFYMLLSQIILAFFTGMYHGPVSKIILDSLPVNVRYTASAIGYNLSYSIFGGLTPVISIFLITTTNNILAPAFYLMFGAFISIISLLTLNR